MRRNRFSGDGHLRMDRRLTYLLFNAIDNGRPYDDLDPGLALADFQSVDALARLNELPGTPSPSRAMCDLFWMHLPWADMAEALGPLRILDLGCGSGEYGSKFSTWSGGRVSGYTGLDQQPHPRWAELAGRQPGVTFLTGDVEHIDDFIPGDTNLIVSQSALEHVEGEAACFDRIRAYGQRAGRPLLQVHLVPSAACLRLYLWHGYRQYTPRTLSSITRSFEGSQRRLVRLGGDACNRLHWRFVTWPLMTGRGDLRDARPDAYRRELAAAVARDMTTPQREPAFHALMIHSNPGARALTADCWRPMAKASSTSPTSGKQ